ncbi:MAG TPA: hypothetical protein VNO26_09660, partial [Candidatus Limnocylindria bacterium]|nr:hypothetical protein [Candidatus Limnocylindria bacterium]
MHRQAVGVLLALVAGAAAAASSSAAPAAAPSVTVRDGRVTASLRQAPLDAVIAALARETGAEVRGALPEPRTVTLDLDAVPLEAALERLLGSRSFTLTYDAEGRLKRLALPAGGATAAAAPPAGAS